ncbi:hypothetical protein [Deinococcus cellulosilyticus]|uniref:Uncharacterized protein n=1 Tax=Deinococcus cellulosilyticus (strain DSM 18568 / NBRC 106333 / KACC 11606 / 5516J-15) TaxID=1223518 RepID=A0A511NBC5_DEIC1|nr:hypothetical protein [Deinococcus cellulosilyticus]GEM50073.1 hypothetical protein DC3_57080 [Deinococcus cellulosilyticus NBRC 106333 = KACC 11606]
MTRNPTEFGLNDQEWNTLLLTPVLAGLTVAHAHASGLTGVRAEQEALEACFAENSDDHALIAHLKTEVLKRGLLEQKPDTNGADLKAFTQGQLLMVKGLLERKTNSEIYRAYSDFLGKVMSRVAGAAREGGLFNAEPNKISDIELQVMSELLKTLE